MTISRSASAAPYSYDSRTQSGHRMERRLSDRHGRSSDDGDGLFGGGRSPGAELAARFSEFQEALKDAQSRSPTKDPTKDDDNAGKDTVSGGGTSLVLFDGTGPNGGGAISPLPEHSRIEERVSGILKNVASQVEAAIRPDPRASSAPFTISIPVEAYPGGLSKVEVNVSGASVVVTLHIADPGLSVRPNQQLIAAATQLGQILQAELPRRKIKIVQSATVSAINQDISVAQFAGPDTDSIDEYARESL